MNVWNGHSDDARRPAQFSRPKLTPAQRDEIGHRRLEGESLQSIATEFDVTIQTVMRCTKKERPE